MKKLFNPLAALFAFILSAFFSTAYAADALDLTPLTTQITAAPIVTAILAVAGVMATIYVAWKGAKMALGALRGL